MDHKRWAHILADYNESIYDAREALKKTKESLWDYMASQKMIEEKSHFAQYYDADKVEKGIASCERRIEELEERIERLTEKRDAWYDQEPPK